MVDATLLAIAELVMSGDLVSGVLVLRKNIRSKKTATKKINKSYIATKYKTK